ncbi:MAG: hypothetical protein M0R50_12400, partial [Candidatus Cloacimonetes bacterium]|nr:hypothetical protein [Candidatus Cloacimonadota bacterium]
MKNKKPIIFNRRKQYDNASIFRSFLEYQLKVNDVPYDEASSIMGSFHRTFAKMLRRTHCYRKPITIKAVNDIDESIVLKARQTLNAVQSDLYGYEQNAQLLWTAVNPGLSILAISENKKLEDGKHIDLKLLADMRKIWAFLKPRYDKYAATKPINDAAKEILHYFIRHNTFDGGIYVLCYIEPDGYDDKTFPTPIIGVAREVREKTFNFDDGDRQGYGIGIPSEHDLRWAEIEYVGINIPVYIQRHALDRLIQRTAPLHVSKYDVY